jgi:hypothetical protein
MPEIPPLPSDLPKPDPPKPPEHPPPDRAALVAAYPAQAPGTADKKTGGQDPATAKTDAAKTDAAKADAPKADAAKVDLTKSLSDAWNRASGAVADTAKDVGNAAKDLGKDVVAEAGKDLGKVEAAVKPGGVVFEGADHFVNPNASEHPERAAVMNNLAKRGEGIADGVTHELKAQGDHLGNLAYYGTHLNETGAPAKALAELKYQVTAPERVSEGFVEGAAKGTVQLAESVGKAGGDLVYYGVMHPDEKVAPAKIANAVTDLVLDGPQLALALDGAAGLGKGAVAGGLSEAETAAAVDRAYKIEPPKVEPPKLEPSKVEPPKVDLPKVDLPETGASKPANDNAVPHQQTNEQVLAPTGTDGAVAGGQPKLNVIEGGKANPDAPRAMAGDPPGPRAPGDGPRPSTAGTDPVISTEKPGQGGARETGTDGDKPGTTPKAATEVKPANDNATPANDNAVPDAPASGPEPAGPSDGPTAPDDELAGLIKAQKDDMAAGFRGETGLPPSDMEPLPDETVPDAGERGRIPELDSREPTRPDPERMQQGNDFDREQRGAYSDDQVRLANGKVLDSYTDGEEIVSRKQTSLAEVSPSTAEGYVNELLDKYSPGTPLADTPENIARYGEGHRLEGDMILEVPVQQTPIPQEFGDWAARQGVTIRDFTGQVLNDIPPR